MTTVDMLDAYTQFRRRVHTEKDGDTGCLIFLATLMDYMFRLGDNQQCLVYWPYCSMLTLSALSCLVRDTVCLTLDGHIQFAILPLSYMKNHRDGTLPQCCCKYCHFNGVPLRNDEFIPSVFVTSLFNKIKERRRVTNSEEEEEAARKTVAAIHTIKVKTKKDDDNGMEVETGPYTHFRTNNDIANGYTMTGALECRRFLLNMCRIKGIIGVSPSPIYNSFYTVTVSSSVTLRLESFSLDSPSRYIGITIIDPEHSVPESYITIPYNALHHGYALRTLVNGHDRTLQCRIESNDSLLFMFDHYAEENTISISGPCKCMCNVDYSLYSLSYDDEEGSVIPLNSRIDINPFIRELCVHRSQHNKKEYTNHHAYHIPPGVPSNIVNGSFDERGSMETYIDMIDLVSRIKITDTGINRSLPEFYLASKGLSVRQLRRGIPSSTLTTPLFNNGNEIAPSLLWAIFYNYRAITLFEVCGRVVSFTPILPGEQFEVVNYVVY